MPGWFERSAAAASSRAVSSSQRGQDGHAQRLARALVAVHDVGHGPQQPDEALARRARGLGHPGQDDACGARAASSRRR